MATGQPTSAARVKCLTLMRPTLQLFRQVAARLACCGAASDSISQGAGTTRALRATSMRLRLPWQRIIGRAGCSNHIHGPSLGIIPAGAGGARPSLSFSFPFTTIAAIIAGASASPRLDVRFKAEPSPDAPSLRARTDLRSDDEVGGESSERSMNGNE